MLRNTILKHHTRNVANSPYLHIPTLKHLYMPQILRGRWGPKRKPPPSTVLDHPRFLIEGVLRFSTRYSPPGPAVRANIVSRLMYGANRHPRVRCSQRHPSRFPVAIGWGVAAASRQLLSTMHPQSPLRIPVDSGSSGVPRRLQAPKQDSMTPINSGCFDENLHNSVDHWAQKPRSFIINQSIHNRSLKELL